MFFCAVYLISKVSEQRKTFCNKAIRIYYCSGFSRVFTPNCYIFRKYKADVAVSQPLPYAILYNGPTLSVNF